MFPLSPLAPLSSKVPPMENDSRHGSAYKAIPKDSSRVPTEANNRPTKSPIFEKKRIFNGSGSGSHVTSYSIFSILFFIKLTSST